MSGWTDPRCRHTMHHQTSIRSTIASDGYFLLRLRATVLYGIVLEKLQTCTCSLVSLTDTWRIWWQDDNSQFIDIVHRYVRRLGIVQDSVALHTGLLCVPR